MKCNLNSFCWLTTVRRGTMIVAWMFILFSLIYLVGYVLGLVRIRKGEAKDICEQLIMKYNVSLSLGSSILGLAIGIIVLVAVYSENPFFLAIGIGLLILNTLIYIFFTFLFIRCFALFISLLFASGIYIYFLVLFASNYFDMRRESMYLIEESPVPTLDPHPLLR